MRTVISVLSTPSLCANNKHSSKNGSQSFSGMIENSFVAKCVNGMLKSADSCEVHSWIQIQANLMFISVPSDKRLCLGPNIPDGNNSFRNLKG